MLDSVKYPLIEFNDSVFEEEKVFFEVFEGEFQDTYELKDENIIEEYKTMYIDSEGFIIKAQSHEIIATRKPLFGKPRFVVKYNYINTNKKIPIEEMKTLILIRKSEHFHITHNKLMTEDEFEKAIKNATEYSELIKIATFMDKEDIPKH